MSHKMIVLSIAASFPLLATATACGGYFLASSKDGFEATEKKRAAFELGCPIDQVQVTELVAGAVPVTPDEAAKGGHGTVIGVSGCGKRATYKFVQNVGWVAENPSTK